MTTLTRLVINNVQSSTFLKNNFASNSVPAINQVNKLEQFFGGMANRVYPGTISQNFNAVQATSTFTIASTGPTNGEVCTIANVTLTATTATTSNNHFVLSTTPTTCATNMAACINASTDLAGIVTATSALGVVTITAVVPGVIGNGIETGVGTFANTTVAGFANGTDGTATTITLT